MYVRGVGNGTTVWQTSVGHGRSPTSLANKKVIYIYKYIPIARDAYTSRAPIVVQVRLNLHIWQFRLYKRGRLLRTLLP